MKILIINGPNLNMLGQREPEIYGSFSLADINQRLQATAKELGDVELAFFQSNHEGEIVDCIQEGRNAGLAGAIINPGGLTHSSVSLLDAIKSVDYPFIEVHLSNLHKREEWRRHSVISAGAVGTIQGLGWRGYEAALRTLVAIARER